MKFTLMEEKLLLAVFSIVVLGIVAVCSFKFPSIVTVYSSFAGSVVAIFTGFAGANSIGKYLESKISNIDPNKT